MALRRFLGTIIMSVVLVMGVPTMAQEIEDVVQLSVQAGYDHLYRTEYWLPLQINVRNQGADITGRLTVRPETSGRIVSNSYSTPIELPGGSEKTAFLYIQARGISSGVLVELVDEEGVRIAEQRVNLSSIAAEDVLHVVVSRLSANSIPLNEAAPGGTESHEVRWEADQIPSDAMALLAVDTLILYDLNSETLTIEQRDAIEGWVAMGGHLIIIGGTRWQETSTAVLDLLPLIPDSGQTIESLEAFGAFVGHPRSDLEGRSFIATGSLHEDAQVLIQTEDGLALLARRQYGGGTVDFLATDPTQEPLRSWDQLADMWYIILMRSYPEPGWGRGFLDSQEAARAVAILPGIDLLPPVSSMAAYIFAYILLIGPVNYFLLSRMNRRGLAWVSIPLIIIVFTGLAWNVGFNLRGSEIIISRLSVIQSYSDSDTARIDQLLGVLSPRRDTYTMTIPERRFLRVMPGFIQNNFLQQNITQSTSDITQGERFIAENIAIDGGIFANFSTSGTIQAPEISGSIIRTGGQDLRGVIRNDSTITLEDAVIVTRNGFYHVSGALEPGDIVNFDDAMFTPAREEADDILPSASPLESIHRLELGNRERNSIATFWSLETARIVMDDNLIMGRSSQNQDSDLPEEEAEETVRRRALLQSFLRDQFAASGIGKDAYLIGWAAEGLPADIELSEVAYRAVDTTLHIIQLEATYEEPQSDELVSIAPDQFMWSVRTRDTIPDENNPLPPNSSILSVTGGINDMTLINRGFAEVRFVPMPDAILSAVESMTIILDRSSSYGRDVALSLWDWEEGEWFVLENTVRETYEIPDAARFIGPNNMVDMRLLLLRDVAGSPASARIRGMKIIQHGQY